MWRWRCGLNECTHQGNEGSLTSDKSFFFPTCSADDMKWEKQPHGSHMSTLKMTVFCLFTFQSVS